jgi:drug/metabolite transporter (DMT)-like permease
MRKALIQMHAAVVLWGFTGVLGKAISLDAPVLVWYRMLFTALFMAVILTVRKMWIPFTFKEAGRISGVGVLICLHWVAFYAAIKYANISVALVCLSTAAIFTSLFDPFINNSKHDLSEILLGLLAIAGVWLIYRYQVSFGLGILFGVIAAVLSSIFTVFNKKLAGKYPARTVVFYEMTTGWLFLSILLPFVFMYSPATVFLPASPSLTGSSWYHNDWLWIVVMSLCCTVWAQSLAISALKHLSSFTATLSVNLEPVYGILLAFYFYNENREIIFIQGTDHVNLGFVVGMSLILLSVLLQMARLIKPRFTTTGFVGEKSGID